MTALALVVIVACVLYAAIATLRGHDDARALLAWLLVLLVIVLLALALSERPLA